MEALECKIANWFDGHADIFDIHPRTYKLFRQGRQYGCIMTSRGSEDKAMPNCILKAKVAPSVEHNANRIEYPASSDKQQRDRRECGRD